MTNFTGLMGRLGKTLGIGTNSTNEATASGSTPSSDPVQEPVKLHTAPDARRSPNAGD